MTVTVTAETWRFALHPSEGWDWSEDKPRKFATRFAAELYVAGMSAADEDRARRRGETNRTVYTITEDAEQ